MFTPKGKFSWFEMMTSDTEAAGKFYSDVVGWTTTAMPSPDGSQYTLFNLGEVGMAGMLKLPEHTGWIGYISVDDVDAHIENIFEAGGKLWKPATDIPGMLRFAVLSDPQGAAIVVFTPNPAMPSPQRPAPPAPGTIGWHEALHNRRRCRIRLLLASSSAGPRSATWIWAPWVLIASSMKATTNRWVTAA